MQICSVICLLIGLTFQTQAQTRTHARAQIPFDFSINNKTLAAGKYAVEHSENNLAVWLLRNAGNRKAIVISPAQPEAKRNNSKGKLTFHRYDNKYFLANVETYDYKIALRQSRAERDLIKESIRSGRLAKNDSIASETVIAEIAIE